MTPTDSLRKKLKLPFPMRGIERKVYAAVFLSIACGVTWSILRKDWHYFERSGSLVIVVAMALVWRDHISLIGDVEKLYKNTFAELLAKLDSIRPQCIINNAMRSQSKINSAVNQGEHDKYEKEAENFEELFNMLRKRVRATEAVIFIIGNVIWGYGKLIGDLIWKLGST